MTGRPPARHAAVLPGTVAVRLLGEAADVAAVLAALSTGAAAPDVLGEPVTRRNRREAGVRVYVTVRARRAGGAR